jgi:cell wall-associated NlpC family hydrolase
MVTGEDMAAKALEYVDVPFVHAGRSWTGVDCVGLLLCVAHDLGLTEWDDVNYSTIVEVQRMRQDVERFGDPVDWQDRQVGDIILFKVAGSAQHVAMITQLGDEPRMVHALMGVDKVVEQRIDPPWERRVVQVYRWRGII